MTRSSSELRAIHAKTHVKRAILNHKSVIDEGKPIYPDSVINRANGKQYFVEKVLRDGKIVPVLDGVSYRDSVLVKQNNGRSIFLGDGDFQNRRFIYGRRHDPLKNFRIEG